MPWNGKSMSISSLWSRYPRSPLPSQRDDDRLSECHRQEGHDCGCGWRVSVVGATHWVRTVWGGGGVRAVYGVDVFKACVCWWCWRLNGRRGGVERSVWTVVREWLVRYSSGARWICWVSVGVGGEQHHARVSELLISLTTHLPHRREPRLVGGVGGKLSDRLDRIFACTTISQRI